MRSAAAAYAPRVRKPASSSFIAWSAKQAKPHAYLIAEDIVADPSAVVRDTDVDAVRILGHGERGPRIRAHGRVLGRRVSLDIDVELVGERPQRQPAGVRRHQVEHLGQPSDALKELGCRHHRPTIVRSSSTISSWTSPRTQPRGLHSVAATRSSGGR